MARSCAIRPQLMQHKKHEKFINWQHISMSTTKVWVRVRVGWHFVIMAFHRSCCWLNIFKHSCKNYIWHKTSVEQLSFEKRSTPNLSNSSLCCILAIVSSLSFGIFSSILIFSLSDDAEDVTWISSSNGPLKTFSSIKLCYPHVISSYILFMSPFDVPAPWLCRPATITFGVK